CGAIIRELIGDVGPAIAFVQINFLLMILLMQFLECRVFRSLPCFSYFVSIFDDVFDFFGDLFPWMVEVSLRAFV
ncbi:hypothetical protein CEXT_801431, partial [Caerostris extrusa]